MKAIVLNSSPNLDRGNTSLISNPFVQELQNRGVYIDFFYSYKMKVNTCLGCFNCMLGRGNSCVHGDDLGSFLSKYCESDFRIFVFPVYAKFIPANMKNIFDRFMVVFDKSMDVRANRTAHGLKHFFKPGKTILISSCSFWEKSNFDLALDFFQTSAEEFNEDLAGKLFRPHALYLREEISRGSKKVDDVQIAARKAAQELLEFGRVSKETELVISRELLTRDDFIDFLEDHYSYYD